MEYLYYVCCYNHELGISVYDKTNDSMLAIQSTRDKKLWKKFTKEEAEEVKKHTGFEIVLIDFK